MFGMLRSTGCGMDIAGRRQWQGYVCGVCLALRNEYGHPARLVTNMDAALLALLHDSLVHKLPRTIEHRCLLRRPHKGVVPDPDSPGLNFAALMALLMAATKVLDRVDDGEICSPIGRRLATYAAERWMLAAQMTARELDFDTSAVVDQVQRQAALESGPQRDFLSYAEPTELAVGAAFRHVSVLSKCAETADTLFDMGRAYGRIMYLLDSVQDYRKDIAAGRFNPLASIWLYDDGAHRIRTLLHDAVHNLRIHLARLDLPQPALTNALLVRQLTCTGNRVLHANLIGEAALANHTSGLIMTLDDPDYLRDEVRRRHREEPDNYPPEYEWGDSSDASCVGDCCLDGSCCFYCDCCDGECRCCEDGCCCCENGCGDGDCGCDGCDCGS